MSVRPGSAIDRCTGSAIPLAVGWARRSRRRARPRTARVGGNGVVERAEQREATRACRTCPRGCRPPRRGGRAARPAGARDGWIGGPVARSDRFRSVSPFRRRAATASLTWRAKPRKQEVEMAVQETIDGSVRRAGDGRSGRVLRRGDGQHRAQARPVPRRWPGQGPLSSFELAARTGCEERYVREWLNSQVAGGYLAYHEESETYELPAEHVPVLVDEDSPVFLPPAFEIPASMWFDQERTLEAFRTGEGIPWGEHDGRLYCGIVRHLPQRLPRLARAGVAARARRRRREARARRARRGRRLRPRALDGADGVGVRALPLRRLRHARGLARGGARRGRGRRRRRAGRVPARRRGHVRRAGLRPDLLLRHASTTSATRSAPRGTRSRRSPRTAR